MTTICLKVRWGPTKSYKLMSFEISRKCIDIVNEIHDRYAFPKEDSYKLYSPPNSSRGPIWFDDNKILKDYNLEERDTIEIKLPPDTCYICICDGSNFNWIDTFNFLNNHKFVVGSILADFNDPINEYIPTIRSLLPVSKDDYCLVHLNDDFGKAKVNWLNSNISFFEQGLEAGAFLLLVQVSALIGNKRLEIELLNIQPDKSEFMTKKSIKTHKVTNPKRRWCVLRGNYLYYYPSQSQTHASGVIPIEYYDLQQNRSKQKYEMKLTHKESFVTNAPTYILECEDQNNFTEWVGAIIRKCSVAAGATVFGIPLSCVMARKNNRHVIPAVITQTVEFLRENNRLHTQGIFRISGSNSAVFKFKEEFDRGLSVNFTESTDPHVVAGLLKLYVRELPEPLLPFSLYKKFISVNFQSGINTALSELRKLVSEIPSDHLKVLKYLLKLLKDVSIYSEENLMTTQNLATVFGPNILRAKENSSESQTCLGDTTTVCSVMEILINHQGKIFTSSHNLANILARSNSAPASDNKRIQNSFVKAKSPRRGNVTQSGVRLTRQLSNKTNKIPPPVPKKDLSKRISTTNQNQIQNQNVNIKPKLTIEVLYDLLMKEREARKNLEIKVNELERKLQNK